MLVHATINIDHSMDTIEDKAILLDDYHLAVFFFRKGKYILYNYISRSIMSEIALHPNTYSAFYYTPNTILTIIPQKNMVMSIDAFTGKSIREKDYFPY